MTTPSQARPSKGNGPRIYAWPPTPPHEFEVLSVTSATKMLPKEFLVGWAAKVTAETAVDKYKLLGQMIEGDSERAAIAWLKAARFRDMANKADRGTIVHAALEAYLGGEPITKEEIEAKLAEKRVPNSMLKSTLGMVDALLQWFADYEPEVLWSESTVYSRTHGYAGTADIIGHIHIGDSRKPCVIDVKTSKAIYDDVACQLAGYARADFVGLDDGTEASLLPVVKNKGLEEIPPIEYGMVVRPTASGTYETATFALTDEVYERFLAALTLAKTEGAEARAKRP
jgi:hypothetical protein